MKKKLYAKRINSLLIELTNDKGCYEDRIGLFTVMELHGALRRYAKDYNCVIMFEGKYYE